MPAFFVGAPGMAGSAVLGAVVPARRDVRGRKPLQSERWAGVVDTVGSHTLANACAATRWNGAVAACGLARAPACRRRYCPSSCAASSDLLDGQLRGRTVVAVDR